MNKTAVITGASSGIGRATAHEFAKKGYRLVLAARREDELEETADECEKLGGMALTFPLDTSEDEAVRNLADFAVEQYGQIDVWVNGAAVYLVGKFEDTPLKDIERLMDVNFFGYIHGSHAALKQFRTQGYGTLINISSVNAGAPMPYVGVYSASKAAIRAFDESLRMELKNDGVASDIKVCTVLPASIDTNLFQNAANYSGKQVQALEPVYEPSYVAKQIVMLAEYPRREVIVGPAGRMLVMQNKYMPWLYEHTISKFTRGNILSETPQEASDGNLFQPLRQHRGVHGGWRETRVRADRMNTFVGVGLGLIAAAALLTVALSSKPSDARE